MTDTARTIDTHDLAAARRNYDALSGWYVLADRFEAPIHMIALGELRARPGEAVLELGPGRGTVLPWIGAAVGADGMAIGVDASGRMAAAAAHALRRVHHRVRAHVVVGDAARVPLPDCSVDAVFTAFALERFPEPMVPVVIDECSRVLRPGGRLVAAAMAARETVTRAGRLYAWAHHMWPQVVDCRPIDTGARLRGAGFRIDHVRHESLWGLPVDVVRATPGPR